MGACYDSFRVRLLASEAAALEHRPVADPAEARAFLQRFSSSAWFRRRFPEVAHRMPGGCRLDVERGRGLRAISGPSGVVVTWAMFRRGLVTRALLLHELAHVVAGQLHGREFAAVLLDFWGHAFGLEARRALRLELASRRVPYRKPKELSPDVLDRLRLQGKVRLGVWRRRRRGLWAPLARLCCGVPMLQVFPAPGECRHECSRCRRESQETEPRN